MRIREENLQVFNKHVKNWAWIVVRSIFLIGFCLVILTPVIDMVCKALMSPHDLYDASINWIPKNITFSNFVVAANAIEFGTAFINSCWFTVLIVLLQLVPCIMAGYGFARYDFKFKGIFFAGVILTLIIPPQMTMVSSYMDFNTFDPLFITKLFGGDGVNLLNSVWPQILMAVTGTYFRNGLFIYLFRQGFKAIPAATEEAAMVDGAGHFYTFYKIMLPAIKTTLTTVVLFSFVWQWNDTFFSATYNSGFKILTNTIAVADYPSFITGATYSGFSIWDTVIRTNIYSTAGLLLAIFPIILFIILQKQFVESIERSGVVG